MSNKKKVFFTRIMAGLLALVMIGGVVIQLVAADEIETPDEEIDVMAMPNSEEFLEENNDRIHFSLGNVPEDFVHPDVKMFLANIEAKKVQVIDFYKTHDYAADVELTDGYYILYSNDIGYKGQNGTKYILNDNVYYNFYIGSDFKADRYKNEDFEYIQDSNIVIDVSQTEDDGYFVLPDANLVLTSDLLQYPINAIYDFEEIAESLIESGFFDNPDNIFGNDKSDSQENENTSDVGDTITSLIEESPLGNQLFGETQNNQSSGDNVIHKVNEFVEGLKEKQDMKTPMEKFIDWIVNNAVLLLLLVGISSAYIVVKIKNNKKRKDQLSEDVYDDGYVK